MLSAQLNMADALLNTGKTKEALDYGMKSLKNARELGFIEFVSDAALSLKNIYEKLGRPEEAYNMYEIYYDLKDSLTNEENRRKSIKKEFQYQYEKKAIADSVKHVEEKKIQDAKINAGLARLQQARTLRFALFGGLGIFVIFLSFIFNRFKVAQKQKAIIEIKEQETMKQKKLIEEQKHVVEEKQKEILDSIYYARRIQRSLLPTEKLISRLLKQKS